MEDKTMPTIPTYLYHVIRERCTVRNLNALAAELGLHYSGAHRGIKHLERAGLIEIKRRGTSALEIVCKDKQS